MLKNGLKKDRHLLSNTTVEKDIWRKEGAWRRKNKELKCQYDKVTINQIIRGQELRWFGHVARM